jgi:signal transduction histidine kinase
VNAPRAAAKRMQPLAVLRLRLTAWYAGTFCLILAMLGGGLYFTMKTQVGRDLDASLRDAVAELTRAAHIREMEAGSGSGRVMDAVDELRILDRTLYLFDATGRPLKPDTAADWIRSVAADAATRSEIVLDHHQRGEGELRVYAKRFLLNNGQPRVAIAFANEIELEDKYASLFAAFGAAAVAALLLIAGGGWFLVRKSTRPVERSMEHMRRFMADAAHELRTPLTVVRTRADVALQQDRQPAEYASALRAIADDAERLGHIVDDLLTLARADAGQRPIDREPVYLDDIALDAADAANVVALAKGVSLFIDAFEEAVVDGDRGLLRQLVMILLDNAIKFTPPGGTVHVAVGASDGRAALTVDDSGAGIPADQLPHVFERFYRGDPARSRESTAHGTGDGAGLGLSIARWIAEAHDAVIDLTSSFGGAGTRASVTFPPPTATSSPRQP